MGDATIQAAIQTLVQALGTFADADVTLGDYKVLGRGSSPYAIVLPGPFRGDRPGDWGQVRYIWTHYVEVWERFTGDSYSAITTARQNVVDQLNKYPTLDGASGVKLATATASGDTMFLWQRGQTRAVLPTFVGFRVTLTTVEEVNYDGTGEFA